MRICGRRLFFMRDTGERAPAFGGDIDDGRGEHEHDDVDVYAHEEVHGQEDDGVDEVEQPFQAQVCRHDRADDAVGGGSADGRDEVGAAPCEKEHGGEQGDVDRRHKQIKPQHRSAEGLRDQPRERGDFEDYAAGEDHAPRLRIVDEGGVFGGERRAGGGVSHGSPPFCAYACGFLWKRCRDGCTSRRPARATLRP